MYKQRQDEDHELLCKLNEDELTLKGKQLAEAENVYNVAEAEKAEANKIFARRLETARAKMKSLGEDIREKRERRTVVCRWYLETEADGREVWALRRTDTGEQLQQQPVTSADRQLELLQGGAN